MTQAHGAFRAGGLPAALAAAVLGAAATPSLILAQVPGTQPTTQPAPGSITPAPGSVVLTGTSSHAEAAAVVTHAPATQPAPGSFAPRATNDAMAAATAEPVTAEAAATQPAAASNHDQWALGPAPIKAAGGAVGGAGAAAGGGNGGDVHTGPGLVPQASAGWVVQTVSALALVLGLVAVLRWLMTRWAQGGGGSLARIGKGKSKPVEVLSRVTVSPKNHVLVMRVGHRLLVVNDTPGGMHTLCNIEDPDEIATVLQAISAGQPHSSAVQFQKMLDHYQIEDGKPQPAHLHDEMDDAGGDDSEAELDRARDRLSALRSRVRSFNLEATP